jgi:16S rRNA C967 or C1407 C5-methylase (RsmB/RsmF family)/NOL1/NOP2/fmu family ribosome biogenesis protein
VGKPSLPKIFTDSLPAQIGSEAAPLLEALNGKAPVSIRFNPFRNHREFEQSEKIPWTRMGYYLAERPPFYADPFFHSGAYYVQEASSMIVEFILDHLDLPERNVTALDLCAAPGGKSTILSTFLENRGLLISNEIVWKRNLILQENLERWGQANTIITHNSSGDFRVLNERFDFALVDAPCSGEGMFRKDPAVISEWSEDNVQVCCERQSEILEDISGSIKTGGYLIYSTCTYNRAENEEQIDAFLEDNPFEVIEIPELKNFGIVESNGDSSLFYRLFPHKLQGEGLSICVLRKTEPGGEPARKRKPGFPQNIRQIGPEIAGDFIALEAGLQFLAREKEVFALKAFEPELLNWLPNLKVIRYGTLIGEENRGELIPSHALALSIHLSRALPEIDLDQSEALRVLQKDSSVLSPRAIDSKWVKLSHAGNALAFAKALPNRMNIHLPKTFRIRKNIDEFL